jgi:hypothetical protein
MDKKTAVTMLRNMETLKILNFIQYRHILELLFGQEDYQPIFHSFEKLQLYKQFVSQLEDEEEQKKHLTNIQEMEQKYRQEDKELRSFIESPIKRNFDRL